MGNPDLDALQALVDAASPSPWTYGDIESVAGGSIYDRSVMIASVLWDPKPKEIPTNIRRVLPDYEADANGAFIAAARSAVPDLIRRVKELESEIALLKATS